MTRGMVLADLMLAGFRPYLIGTAIGLGALRFFVIAFVVLPLLPDRAMGPYGVLNPSKIWLLVVAVTGLGWVGYVAVRALGPERGLLITGFAGGISPPRRPPQLSVAALASSAARQENTWP